MSGKLSNETDEAGKALKLFAICGYMLCSSLMLLSNKLAVNFLPAPSFVLFSQLSVTAVGVWTFGQLGVIKVDKLEMSKVKSYSLVAFIFLSTIFTNIKCLQYSNVETFIVFRASTPLVISLCDYAFLNRALPNMKSTVCLLGLLAGAAVYVMWDHAFEVKGYMWVGIWYVMFTIDQIYIKRICDVVKMDSNWGRVFYTNLLASLPLVFLSAYDREVTTVEWTNKGIAALLLSCVLGVAMSYFAFLARSLISATYFTIVGNACKLLTVVANQLIWDKHANGVGVASLLFCLVCAYFYEQAPLRSTMVEPKYENVALEDENKEEVGLVVNTEMASRS